MNAYMGCCCAEPEIVLCDNGDPSANCPPVAIVVEGRIRQTVEASSLETSLRSSQCFVCGVLQDGSYNYETEFRRNGSQFATITFKALLIRTQGNVYSTSNQSQYQPVASIFADAEGVFSYTQRNTVTPCIGSCGNSELIETNNETFQTNNREDPVVTGFSMIRSASFFDCQTSDSACRDYPSACYEQFDVSIHYDYLVEYSGLATKYFRFEQLEPFSGDCVDVFPPNSNYQYTCANENIVHESIGMKRWAPLYPSEIDTCPLNEPRPIRYLELDLVGSIQTGCPPVVEACDPGDCQGFSQGGETLFAYDFPTANIRAVQLVPGQSCPDYGSRSYAFVAGECQDFYTLGGGYVTSTFSHTESAQAGCGQSDVSCLFSKQCAPPRPIDSSSQLGPINRSGTFETTIGAEFEITRHDLLYSLPDPSDWPQNV